MKDVTGRTVLITGGAQGIGLGMARAFIRAGAQVAVADLDQDRLRVAERELADAEGAEVAAHRLDVRDRAEFARVVDAVQDRFGPVDILCNNAGVGTVTPVRDLRYDQWDLVLGVNLGGVVNGIQTVLPRMLARGAGGHIVNTASGAGLSATAGQLTYVTSKFGVVGLSESLRLQPELVAAGIGTTVVCPGLVRTDVIRNSATAGERSSAGVEAGHALLQRYGLDPDTVGEQVLAAVRAEELYVMTDRYLAPLLDQRALALTAALPAETDRDRELAALLRERTAARS